MKAYRFLTSALILGWFVVALTIAARGGFTNAYNRLGVSVAIASLMPLLVFFAWFAASKSFRQFSLSLSPVLLTAVQSWRLFGFTFVLLEARHSLPAIFALPAGYGDMFVGATAILVAWKFAATRVRGVFIGWQILGITDLVLAVTLGSTAPLLDPHSVPITLMTVLPLSLIPTFFVPMYLIFHVICIAQARSWQPEAARTDHDLHRLRPINVNG